MVLKMLNPHSLTDILQETSTGGIMNALLLTTNGSLVAFSGSNKNESNAIAAIVCNVWSTYKRAGNDLFDDTRPQFVLMDNEDGRLVVTAVADFLLCLKAQKIVGFGMLKLKAHFLTCQLAVLLRNLV